MSRRVVLAGARRAVNEPCGCACRSAKADPGGLWGPLFLSQHSGEAGRLAALGGPWLVTFAIVGVNYALALVVVRGRLGLLACGLLVVLLVAAQLAPAAGSAGLTLAAVQPGYDTAEKERPELRYFRHGTYDLAALDTIRDLGSLTRAAARRGAELVVWPEAAIWVDPRHDPLARLPLRRLAAETGAALVVPYFLRDRARGATVVLTLDGGSSRSQPKQRPMWFLGENGDNGVRVCRPV